MRVPTASHTSSRRLEEEEENDACLFIITTTAWPPNHLETKDTQVAQKMLHSNAHLVFLEEIPNKPCLHGSESFLSVPRRRCRYVFQGT